MSKNSKDDVKRYIRAIHFDLDTHVLEEQYPKNNWRKAYDDIGIFLKSKGFTHRQGSGYISNEALSKYQVSRILRQMSQELSFLNGAVKTLDVDNIIEEKFDYGVMFESTKSKSKSKANEKADAVEKDNNMSDDKTVDNPQDWRYNNEDEELDLTQEQNRGRS